MLYIFHVDTGTMMTFDMNLALDSVKHLKKAIFVECQIPADMQVLLVSGGECLDPSARVCSYSAGTDTNPIFLFSKCNLDSMNPPAPLIDYGSDSDLEKQLNTALQLPASYTTVVARSQLAQQFYELAKEQVRACEQLVHDQHLQQQGWAAAVANLEDITADFRNSSERFEQSYNQHLQTREENLLMLQNFNEDLQTLSKIPILPPLLENVLSISSSDECTKTSIGDQNTVTEQADSTPQPDDTTTDTETKEQESISLLQWISSADNQSSLEKVADQSYQYLVQFNASVADELKKEVLASLTSANKKDLKEIKGLEERLYGLEQLMCESKKIVQEQCDLAQSFQQNQARASNLGDTSILPDLCASHSKQLVVMLKNQTALRDIRRRCSKAKEELSVNLFRRLGWVMYVENEIVQVNNKLMIYYENLRRLRRYLEVTRQVQRAPQMYVAAVGEVVRRRTFSHAFLNWASDLSSKLFAIYNEESDRRRDFMTLFEGHFLQSLFPGFDDNPPAFATQPPVAFDSSLPKLTNEDIEHLRTQLPELSLHLSTTKLSALAEMFLGQSQSVRDSGTYSKEGESKLEQTLIRNDFIEPRKIIARDDRDLESETDTDEFEKVCQSPVDFTFDNKQTEPQTERAATDTMFEIEQLRNHLTNAGKLANETANALRLELCEIRSSMTARDSLLDLAKDIQTHVTQLTRVYTEELSTTKSQIEEKSLEMQALVEKNKLNEEKLASLQIEFSKIQEAVTETNNQNEDLLKQIELNRQKYEAERNELVTAHEERDREAQQQLNEHQSKITQLQGRISEIEVREQKSVEDLKNEHNTQIETLQSKLIQTELNSEVEREKTLKELSERLAAEHALELKDVKDGEETRVQIAVKEATDRLLNEHRTEFENLRTRFRLMSVASMEKSPSDSSLEKIERYDVIELVNHEAIVSQLKEDMLIEKENAVQEAVNIETENYKKKLEEELKLVRSRMEIEKQVWLQEAVTRATTEKDKCIENLEKKQSTLMTECQRHRDTIRLLTDGECIRGGSSPGAGTVDPLVERIETLERKNKSLENELEIERRNRTERGKRMEGVSGRHSQRHDEMSGSVAVVPVLDVAGSSCKSTKKSESTSRDNLSSSTNTLLDEGKINVSSCTPGDFVLVVWDVDHANYMVLQNSDILYFLHFDCQEVLGLRPGSDGSPRKLFCIAVVVDKEYCQARKSENRYRVAKGTKFYRVRVQPMGRRQIAAATSTCTHHSGDYTHVSQPQDPLRHSLESGLTSSQLSIVYKQADTPR